MEIGSEAEVGCSKRWISKDVSYPIYFERANPQKIANLIPKYARE